MATSFSNIYELFLLSITDDAYFATLPSYQYYEDVFVYLKKAISTFRTACYKDLTDFTAFSSTEYTLTGDGTDSYTLSPTPPTDETSTYITVAGTETEDYIRSGASITFDSPVTNGQTIFVATFDIGEFAADLNYSEIDILAQIMVLPMLQQELHDVQKMRTSLFSPDFKVFSPAEKMKEIRNAIIEQKNYIRTLISDYQYADDPNDLEKLFGGADYSYEDSVNEW